jgi:hypothetical protein
MSPINLRYNGVLIMRLDNTRGYRGVALLYPIQERNSVHALFNMLLACLLHDTAWAFAVVHSSGRWALVSHNGGTGSAPNDHVKFMIDQVAVMEAPLQVISVCPWWSQFRHSTLTFPWSIPYSAVQNQSPCLRFRDFISDLEFRL